VPELLVIDNEESLESLTKYLTCHEYVAYDIETTGVAKGSTIIGFSLCAEDEKAFYVITHKWNATLQTLDKVGGAAYDTAVLDLLAVLQTKNVIAHNAIFDISMTKDYYGIDLMPSLHTDTLILAHLLNENRRVGLKELGRTMFGENADAESLEMKASVLANGGKLTKADYEMYKADPYLMGKYGAKDAWLTFRLFHELLVDLADQDLYDFFYQDESMPMLKGPTYQLNTVGLKVDMGALQTLKKTLEAECVEAKAFIYAEIDAHIKVKYPGTSKKTVFNIGSNPQLSWLMFGQLGLEFGTLTKEGKEVCRKLGIKLPYAPAAKREFIRACTEAIGSVYQPEALVNGKKVRAKKVKEPWSYTACDKKIQAKYAAKHEWVAKLLEYNKKIKILSTYINGIESRTKYGIIHPSFLQHGTTSGRYSSRDPNFQNLPRDDKRVKSLIVARPGRVFVGADYSQLEPRVFAYFSKDERLRAAFKGSDDFYSVIGMEVYDKTDCTPHKEGSPEAFGVKYKNLRDLSKVIALAATYGATSYQLSQTTGKSAEDTQQDMDNYFERFPGVAQFMLDSHEVAKKHGQVTSLFGRPRRIPEARKITKIYGKAAHSELPYEVRSMLNLSVNHRVQSTGASIVNRAAIKFYNDCKDLGIEAPLVVQVHDSLIAECMELDAENVSLLLQNAMETAVTLEGVDLEAVPKIGKNLAEV
jgi:DNA polymerase I-like protein with 3'-5' exonuclease and polymerase domains